MHFIVARFELVSSIELKSFDKISSFLIISVINPISSFFSHLHKAFFLALLYPLNEQLFSHKDKLLLIYSFCRSFNNISVPLSVVYGLHLSL